MSWHGQINRTIWEIESLLSQKPGNQRLRREFLRTHFLQRYEYDRGNHVPRDDRSFLFMQEERAPAALLLHGAHGTPAEMRDLGNFLYSKGFTVFCPRLSRYDLKNRLVSWEAWVTAAETALTATLRYSENTLIVGMSLGGTVALQLQRMYPVKGVALLAPALYARMGVKGAMYALMRRVAPTLFHRFAGWNGEAIKAMDRIRQSTDEITVPLLAIQSRDDHVLSARGIRFLQRKASNASSEVEMVNQGTHALTRGPIKEEVFDRIFQFTCRIQLTNGRVANVPPPRSPAERPGERSPGGSPRRRRRGSRGGRGRARGRRGEAQGSGPAETGGGGRQPDRSRGSDAPRRDRPAGSDGPRGKDSRRIS